MLLYTFKNFSISHYHWTSAFPFADNNLMIDYVWGDKNKLAKYVHTYAKCKSNEVISTESRHPVRPDVGNDHDDQTGDKKSSSATPRVANDRRTNGNGSITGRKPYKQNCR